MIYIYYKPIVQIDVRLLQIQRSVYVTILC